MHLLHCIHTCFLLVAASQARWEEISHSILLPLQPQLPPPPTPVTTLPPPLLTLRKTTRLLRRSPPCRAPCTAPQVPARHKRSLLWSPPARRERRGRGRGLQTSSDQEYLECISNKPPAPAPQVEPADKRTLYSHFMTAEIQKMTDEQWCTFHHQSFPNNKAPQKSSPNKSQPR